MKKILSKSSNFLLGLVLATLFLVSFKLVKAWVEPTQAPPNGNLGAIMTTNSGTQLKAGAFGSSNTPGYGQTLMQQWGLSSSGTMYLEPAGGSDLALTDSWANIGNLRVEFARAYMPIIYDRDNTAYYDDPHSTSRMNYVVSDNTYTYGNENTNDIYIRAAGKWASQLGNDNLGNHTATTFLNMNWNDISNVNTETVSKSVIGGGSSSNWATVNAPTFNAGSSIYSYGTICAGNQSGDCSAAGGVVISAAGQAGNPNVSITSTGNSYFNAGNLGIGTTSPNNQLSINGATGLLNLGAKGWIDPGANGASIVADNSTYKSLMIVGNNIAGNSGKGREVKVWDYLNVQGYANANSGLCINGDCRTSWPSGLQLNTWQGSHYSGSDGAEYATVLYDSNNAGYYIDPSNGSNITTIYADAWFRAKGDSGYYFENHGGGWNMTDNTWIRAYGTGNVYAFGESQATTVRANTNLCIGSDCRSAWPSGGDNLGNHTATATLNMNNNQIINAGNVGIGIAAPASKLAVGGTGNAAWGTYSLGSTIGVYGESTNFGVYGVGTDPSGVTGGVGVYGQGARYAGYFNGNVYVGNNFCMGATCSNKWPASTQTTCQYVSRGRMGGTYNDDCPAGYYVAGMQTTWGGASLDGISLKCCRSY